MSHKSTIGDFPLNLYLCLLYGRELDAEAEVESMVRVIDQMLLFGMEPPYWAATFFKCRARVEDGSNE